MKPTPQPPSAGHQFLAPKEVATILRINVRTVYNLAKIAPENGGPPVRRLSRKLIRFPKQKFNEWANNVDLPAVLKGA